MPGGVPPSIPKAEIVVDSAAGNKEISFEFWGHFVRNLRREFPPSSAGGFTSPEFSLPPLKEEILALNHDDGSILGSICRDERGRLRVDLLGIAGGTPTIFPFVYVPPFVTIHFALSLNLNTSATLTGRLLITYEPDTSAIDLFDSLKKKVTPGSSADIPPQQYISTWGELFTDVAGDIENKIAALRESGRVFQTLDFNVPSDLPDFQVLNNITLGGDDTSGRFKGFLAALRGWGLRADSIPGEGTFFSQLDFLALSLKYPYYIYIYI